MTSCVLPRRLMSPTTAMTTSTSGRARANPTMLQLCSSLFNPAPVHSLQDLMHRCPVYNGTCQPNLADGSAGGPVHVVLGNAGFTLSYLPNPFLPPYWKVR